MIAEEVVSSGLFGAPLITILGRGHDETEVAGIVAGSLRLQPLLAAVGIAISAIIGILAAIAMIAGLGSFVLSFRDALRSALVARLQLGETDAVMIMLGTKDVSSVEFGANLATLIEWKKAFAPKAPMIILGLPPRADAAESEYLAPIRDAAALIVAQYEDPLIKFVDCSGAFDPNGQNLPDQVHLSAAAHEALVEHIEVELKAGGIWSKI